MEDALLEQLRHGRWYARRATIDSLQDPLTWLTEQLACEPAQWVGWSVEGLFNRLPAGEVIVIDGATAENWEAWRTFLRDFDVASRQRASDERPVLLVFVRGVPQKQLQASGAALTTSIWSGVFGELDTLIYVDQRLRRNHKPALHHKLIVRQIAALALWDIDLADYLVDQPERDVFEIQAILKAARLALGRGEGPMGSNWESGGLDHFDGVEMRHPFALLDGGDPAKELQRRMWTAQAAELLPLVEVRRRELIQSLEQYVSCPFWIDGKREIRSLHELEIGSLAYVSQTRRVRSELRERAELLARCRNTLAHLGLLRDGDALDPRLYQ
jgi:hypothetical protein